MATSAGTANVRQAACKTEAWLSSQNEAFKAAIDGAPLEETLGILTLAAVKRVTDATSCAFYLANDEGTELSHIVGMPQSYADKVKGFPIGPDSTACGLAASIGEPVITADVRDDPAWEPWLWLAEEYDYRACWSFPIELDGGRLGGTFAMYFEEPHSPTAFDLGIAKTMCRAASLLIAQQRAAEKIRAASEALRDSKGRMRVLLGELQHRVRNTLAVVKSITARTADSSASVEDMAAHLMGRLDAFARVQSAVARNPGSGVDLDMIVMDELAAHAIRAGEHLSIHGPQVKLDPKAAETISLAVHELTTNAVKHGPFGRQGGQLKVNWRIAGGQGPKRRLLFEWTEAGLDRPPAEPTRHGFGMELLKRVLPYDLDAETDLRFAENGLQFTMQLPVRHVVGTERRAARLPLPY